MMNERALSRPPMKALTICQPYAHLIVHGEKRVENRTWRAPPSLIGQWFAIHAGKSQTRLNQYYERYPATGCMRTHPMAFGAVVGSALLLGCYRIEDIRSEVRQYEPSKRDSWMEADKNRMFIRLAFPWLLAHEHCEGPWCWVLGDVTRFDKPVPCRGAQKLFDASALMYCDPITGIADNLSVDE